MGLSEFTPEVVEVKFKSRDKDFSFTVRGLNTDDFTTLVKMHLTDLEEAKKLYDKSRADIYTRKNWDNFILSLITTAPGLAAEIVSVAADEPHLVERYRSLPLPVSAQALAEIARMTLEDIGGVRPFAESLGAVLKLIAPPGVLQMIQEAAARFSPSTGTSAAT